MANEFKIKHGLIVSGSTTLSGSISITGAITSSSDINTDTLEVRNLTVTQTASITYLDTRFESASVIYSSGSNIFGDADDDIQTLNGDVVVNGTDLFVDASTSRVGIGTASPLQKLHVIGSIKASDKLFLGGNADVIDPSSNSGMMTIGSNTPIRFTNASTTEYARITTSGNVGIGVASPSTKLEVVSSQSNSSIKAGGLEMQSYAVNNSWYAENLYYDGAWKLRSAGFATQMYMELGKISFNRVASGNAGASVSPQTTMVLAANGNVGIGTTSPSQKLHVDGHALISAEKYYYVAGTGAGVGSDASGNLILRQNSANLMTTSGSNATFAGQVSCDTNTTTPTSGDAVFYKASAGAVLSGYQAILETGGAGSRATALTLNNSQNATFTGDVKLEKTANTESVITLNPNSSALGTNYQWNLVGGNSATSYAFQIREGSTSYLSIDNSAGGGAGNATFAGNVILGTGDNLYLNGTTGFRMLHDGSNALFINQTAGDIKIQNSVSDKDIIFKGLDGASTIDALTLDMSEGGNATFAGSLDVRGGGSGYNSIKIVNNLTTNNNKQAGITTENYAGNSVSIIQYATTANGNTIYYGSADGAHSGLSNHRFYVNADPNTPGSGHTQALHISSDTNATFAGNIATAQTKKLLFDGSGGHTYITEESDSNLKFYVGGTEAMLVSNNGTHFTSTLTIPSYIYHASDPSTDTYFGFNGNDNFTVVTAGGNGLVIDSNRNATFTGHIALADSKEIRLGAGTDLKLYSNGTDGYVVAPVDDLVLQAADDVFIYTQGGEDAIIARGDGGVELYHNNAKKLETTSTGIEITGNIDSPTISINDYITHNGDTNTYFGFSGADTYTVVTGGTTALTLDASQNATFAGVVLFNDNQGINFGNSNAKIYGSSADGIKFNGNGSEKMRLTQAGNVGIGTTTPGSKLNIETTKTVALSTAADFLTLGLLIDDTTAYSTAGGGGGIAFRSKRNSSGTQTVFAAIDGAKEGTANDGYTGTLRFYTNQNSTGVPLERMRISSAGNVGIGTTSPGSTLPTDSETATKALQLTGVSGNTGDTAILLRSSDNSSGLDLWHNVSSGDSYIDNRYNSDQGDIIFRAKTAGTPLEALRITGAGNVGIGTTSPGTINGVAFSGVGLHTKAGTLGRTITEGTSFAEFIMNHSNASANQKVKFVLSKAGVLELGSMDDNGTRRTQLSILNNDNVGIGTTSPSEKLEVVGDIKTSGTGNTRVLLESGGSCVMDLLNAQSEAYLRTTTAHDLHFRTTDTNRMVIKAAGNVGIGTTSPAQKLHVSGNFLLENNNEIRQKDSGGTERTIIELDSSNDLNIGGSYAGALKFIGGGSYAEVMRIHDDGNVGIGTTSPTGKLEIQRSQVTTQFDRDSFLRLHPTATTNSGGFTNIMFGTSTTNNYGVTIGGRKAGTGDTSSNNNPEFSVRILNDSITGTEVLNINTAGNATFAGSVSIQSDNDERFLVRSNDYTISRIISRGNSGTDLDKGLFSLMSSDGTNNNVEVVRLDSAGNSWLNGGNVGIGTISPGAKLSVVGNGATSATDALLVENSSGTDLLAVRDDGRVSLLATGYLYFGTAQVLAFNAGNEIRYGYASAVQKHTFYTNGGTAQLHITNDNKVGIGTTSPSEKLTVAGNISGSGDVNIVGDVTASAFVGDGSALTGITATDSTKLPLAGGTMTGNTKHNDNVFSYWGNNDDLAIRHNATDTYIENYTGDLQIVNYADDKDIIFKSDDGSGGDTEYFRLDGSEGITVSSRDMRMVDNRGFVMGTDGDSFIKHTGTQFSFFNDTGDAIFYNRANDKDFQFHTDDGSGGTTAYFTLDGSSTHAYFSNPGNVGIGVTSPETKLQVNGTIRAFGSSGDAYSIAGSSAIDGNTRFAGLRYDRTNSVAKFGHYRNSGLLEDGYIAITSGSNVGIGTASPAEKLTVSGDANITGKLAVGSASAHGTYAFYNQLTAYFNGAVTIDDTFTQTGGGNSTFSGDVLVEDNLHLTDAGTVRGKLILNASDRDNVELRAESLGSTMKFFTAGTEALGLDASQNATFGGSVTIPEYLKHANDADTYFGFSTNNQVLFHVGGGDRLIINSSGNVGIGTTSPSGKLHVRSANAGSFTYDTTADDLIVESNANGGITIATAAANTGRVIFASPDDATGSEISFNASGALMKIGTTTGSGQLILQSGNGSEALRADSSGNIGIGTTSPGATLDVVGAGRFSGYVRSNFLNNYANSKSIIGAPSNYVSIYDGSGVEAVRVDASGNVGINTTSPSQKLEVNGTAKSVGLYVTGTARIDTGGSTPGAGPSPQSQAPTQAQVRPGGNPDYYLSEPDEWLLINIGGTDYVLPAYEA